MKYVSIDTETTGLDPREHHILEIGAVVEDTNDPKPYEALPTFHTYVIPDDTDQIVGSLYALSMNSEILRDIQHNLELPEDPRRKRVLRESEVWGAFAYFLEKNGHPRKHSDKLKGFHGEDHFYYTVNPAGKNFGGFDKQFLDNLPNFKKYIHFRHRCIDPSIYYVDWKFDKHLPDLKRCKERAGISGEVAHTAVEDCIDVIKLLRPFYH